VTTQDPPDLDRIAALARALAASDSGPAAELGCALADAVTVLSRRVDALWQVIDAALVAAGLGPAERPDERPADRGGPPHQPAGPPAGPVPPAELVRALTAPQACEQGIRLNIDGKDWVAAISPDARAADPSSAWAALQRLTQTAGEDQDPG